VQDPEFGPRLSARRWTSIRCRELKWRLPAGALCDAQGCGRQGRPGDPQIGLERRYEQAPTDHCGEPLRPCE
jgi:hypothetical protein